MDRRLRSILCIVLCLVLLPFPIPVRAEIEAGEEGYVTFPQNKGSCVAVYKSATGWYLAGLDVDTYDDLLYIGWQASAESQGRVRREDYLYLLEAVWDSQYHRFILCYQRKDGEKGPGHITFSADTTAYIADTGFDFSFLSATQNGWETAPAELVPNGGISTDARENTSLEILKLMAKRVDRIEPDAEMLVKVENGANKISVAQVLVEYLDNEVDSLDELMTFKGTDAGEAFLKLAEKLASTQAVTSIVNDIKNGDEDLGNYLDPEDAKKSLAVVLGCLGEDNQREREAEADRQDTIEHTRPSDDDIVDNGEGGFENAVAWKNWYIAATGVASGVAPTDELSPLKEKMRYENGVATERNLYEYYNNLKEMLGDDESDFRMLYEVLAVAMLGGKENPIFTQWMGSVNPDEELKSLFTQLGGRGSSVVDYTILSGLVSKINEANNSQDQSLKRFSTINERLTALLVCMSTQGFSESDANYKWIHDWYDVKPTDWTITRNMLSDQCLPIITAAYLESTSSNVQFSTAPQPGQEMIGYYIIQTIFEIPYLTKFYLKDLNDTISGNTDITNNDLYKAVKSIHDAKESLHMPALDVAWEYRVATDEDESGNIQFTSLADIWEKMHELAGTSDEEAEDASEPLETGKPMKWFFKDYMSGKLSEFYVQGIAYTSILVPMRSNVYSEEWIEYLGEEFREKFYHQWGFNRKALYIDKTSGAGEAYYSSRGKRKGSTKVCTLRDLVECKGDVVLYLDDNFYNAKEMQEVFTNTPSYFYTEPTVTESESEESQDEQPAKDAQWWAQTAVSLEDAYSTDFEKIVKTGDSINYSKTFYEMMSEIEDAHTYYPKATKKDVGNVDNSVLSSGKINYYLDSDNTGSEIYTPLQGYAVVSAVYRDADLFNKANSKDAQKPVFIASATAPYVKNASVEACQTIFNYALVRNLRAAMPIGFSGNIDMDCPIYMDILGNIVSESGTVVVPALANATLQNKSDYFNNMWAAGLFTVYGLDYKIPVKKNESVDFKRVMGQAFQEDESGEYYIPQPRTLGDTFKVDMSRLSTTSKNTLDMLYQMAYANAYNSSLSDNPSYDFDRYFQIAMEVLRGAPIENIDKEVEGIDTLDRIDRAGIIAAAKLEELNNSLKIKGVNTTLYIPSLAFMPGISYVVLLVFKILLLVVIVVNMVTIYYDAVSESLGFGTARKCVIGLFLTMITVITIPAIFEATYYQSNRTLLQNEAIQIAMLNQEKSASGVEIGVTEVKEPDISTKLYLELQDIQVPWYDLFYNAMFANSYKSVNDMYDTYVREHSTLAFERDVQVKNDGVYVDVQDIFDSSSVDLDMSIGDSDKRILIQTAEIPSQTFSFYSPYYAILDALIQNVNYFNANPWNDNTTDINGWYSYTIKEQKGGKYKTMGLIEPYLTSEKFLNEDRYDPLGLKFIYKDMFDSMYEVDPAVANFYASSNLEAMKKSAWYPNGISSVEMEKRLDYLTESARRFVVKHRELLGKISDDTFLKAMALTMAVEHNNAFGNEAAASFEIYNLSNDDLVRLSIASADDVMLNSTLSYPRFVYAVGGSTSVFAAALLSMVLWISGIVKPVLVVLAFVVIFVSIFIFKVCMRKPGVSLYGYFITTLLLAGTNICYSIMLKLSMFLPRLGLTPFMCIILQVILQIAYMVILLNVVWTAFKDWRDLGYARYANKFQDMQIGFLNFFRNSKKPSNPFYGGTSKVSTPEKNWQFYDNMMEERHRRVR